MWNLRATARHEGGTERADPDLFAPPWSDRNEARKVGWPMLTCDYNGWNDAPEDEREWFDQHPEIWDGGARERDTRLARVIHQRRSGWAGR